MGRATNRETARTVQIDHADNADGPGNQQSQVLYDAEPKGRQRTDPADKIGAAKTIL
jgi:hypothetical protein